MPDTPAPYIRTLADITLGHGINVWTDDNGHVRGVARLGAADITFGAAAQVREAIAYLAILAHEMDAEAARQEEGDGEDDEDDGDTLNDQTAPYWPALGLGGSR